MLNLLAGLSDADFLFKRVLYPRLVCLHSCIFFSSAEEKKEEAKKEESESEDEDMGFGLFD
jgi:hypothetical protein